MADIRINALATTAASTASDDFIAVDGSANGTRKLSAYSPTFGGNLTVSGTASVTGQINGSAGYQFRGATGTTYELLRYAGGTNNPGVFATVNESTKKVTIIASGSLVSGQTLGLGAEGSESLTLGAANATLAGNLTVSGGQTLTVGSSANYSLWKDATPTKAGRVILNNTVTNGLSLGLYDGSSWVDTLHISPANNVLIGGTIDGGQKLQVSGDAAISDVVTFTGGGVSAYTNSTARIYNQAFVGLTLNGSNLQFRTGLSGTTALTLDSSQNATFAGNGQIGANYTVAQKKLEIIGGSYADGQTLRLADYSTAYGFDIVNDGVNAKLKIVRHSNSVGGTEAMSIDRDTGNATFAGTVKVNNKGIVKSEDNVNIGTSATTIFTLSGTGGASFCFVCGDNGSAGFADLVVTVGNGEAVTVISSATIYGSPAARTYTTSGTSLKLAMASGVMNVRTTAIYTA